MWYQFRKLERFAFIHKIFYYNQTAYSKTAPYWPNDNLQFHLLKVCPCCKLWQGILTEREGSLQLTSLYLLVQSSYF